MGIVVQKYGGTSVGDIEKIKNVAKRVAERKKEGNDIVVVVSAMGKTTDKLVDMAKSITENPCKREMDMLLSTGEQITIALLSMALKEYGYDSISLTGSQAGIVTEGIHTKNRIKLVETDKIKTHLDYGKIVVVAGFQGVNEKGDITTLGRGGSDTTAVALAAKLNCTCEIYTDVDGVYTVDPRIFPNAKKLKAISYEEMMEMASMGAGVLETRAVEIAFKYKIPIYLAINTGNVEGTYVKEKDKEMEKKAITGLTVTDDILMITINKVEYTSKNIALIFDVLARNNVNIDMISQTAPHDNYVNVSFTASKDDIFTIKEVIKELENDLQGIDVDFESNISKISVVGIGMMNQSGVAAMVFKVFSENNIDFKQVTTSEISISYTIDSSDRDKAVNVLAKALNL
ncbi:aspartate kinase [Oceanirhabdus sp. W0125-5]|uniref:aspartate kinase n=1 Tax=Oceanirhabdus sp. W0125-5 TaxID=2999116 RepID=UPI0022F31270|nr:aspartate kinase [Oceanirhabdus sp. W0125-5]WBW94932.1 aspartate kinase [Oceanirhabdus sp. W0125-5]